MRVGLLTGGGDCPGPQRRHQGVVRGRGPLRRRGLVGSPTGGEGVIKGSTMPLDIERCRGILPRGHDPRNLAHQPYKVEGGVESAMTTLREQRVDAWWSSAGGTRSGVAHKLVGLRVLSVVGVPQDDRQHLSATESPSGFHTAVQIAHGRHPIACTRRPSRTIGDRVRGDGPARGLDCDLRRHRRRGGPRSS